MDSYQYTQHQRYLSFINNKAVLVLLGDRDAGVQEEGSVIREGGAGNKPIMSVKTHIKPT